MTAPVRERLGGQVDVDGRAGGRQETFGLGETIGGFSGPRIQEIQVDVISLGGLARKLGARAFYGGVDVDGFEARGIATPRMGRRTPLPRRAHIGGCARPLEGGLDEARAIPPSKGLRSFTSDGRRGGRVSNLI